MVKATAAGPGAPSILITGTQTETKNGKSLMDVRFVRQRVEPHGVAPAEEAAMLRLIERCGRTAYKSEDRITEDSAKKFVQMLDRRRHLSVLEHSNIVLKIEDPAGSRGGTGSVRSLDFAGELTRFLGVRNAFHRVRPLHRDEPEGGFAVAGNLRAWVETREYLAHENPELFRFFQKHLHHHFPALFPHPAPGGRIPDLDVTVMEPEEQLELLRDAPGSDLPSFVFKIVCDRGITHEIVRHRVLSFTQESTRYVNYRQKGFAFILPEELEPWYKDESGEIEPGDPIVGKWLERCRTVREWYLEDVERGLTPQIARDVLPHLVKSEIFVSGRWSGWKHFIELRDSKEAHPRVRRIARDVRLWFENQRIHAG